jgi:hypothetical protein
VRGSPSRKTDRRWKTQEPKGYSTNRVAGDIRGERKLMMMNLFGLIDGAWDSTGKKTTAVFGVVFGDAASM